jgi:putative endonuclease
MSHERSFWVYILASKIGGTLYIGVTNDLVRRVFEHREKLAEGFTKKYEVARLVYFEEHSDIESAIRREKRLKSGIAHGRLDLSKRIIRTGMISIRALPSLSGFFCQLDFFSFPNSVCHAPRRRGIQQPRYFLLHEAGVYWIARLRGR